MKLSSIGTFDTLNPFIIKGVPAAGIGAIFDTLMVRRRGRAGERLRAGRRERRSCPRSALRPLHAAQDGALSRRHADHPGGRGVDLRDAAREGSTALPLLLRRRDQGRDRRRARRALSLQVGRQPRIAGNPRRDAGAVEGVLVGPRFREDDARPAARQRALHDPNGRSRAFDHLSPGPRLLGQGSAGQQGPLQCRYDPLRLLPRRDDRARSLQGRGLRHPPGELIEGLGDRL